MTDPAETIFAALLLAPVVLVAGLVGKGCYDQGYQRGQTDALTGQRIFYQLQTFPDGERRWVLQDKPTTRPATEDR